ncbi:hypothetical protein DENSPDRAFT_839712 [Dentipellis sp. KUC8613]|nr:hypothetical protein DENSPDRAFT_839712 [Dentipellis sp. KUC8613]
MPFAFLHWLPLSPSIPMCKAMQLARLLCTCPSGYFDKISLSEDSGRARGRETAHEAGRRVSGNSPRYVLRASDAVSAFKVYLSARSRTEALKLKCLLRRPCGFAAVQLHPRLGFAS